MQIHAYGNIAPRMPPWLPSPCCCCAALAPVARRQLTERRTLAWLDTAVYIAALPARAVRPEMFPGEPCLWSSNLPLKNRGGWSRLREPHIFHGAYIPSIREISHSVYFFLH